MELSQGIKLIKNFKISYKNSGRKEMINSG
jgi:hypothetical protein